jgi:hypothetical protein
MKTPIIIACGPDPDGCDNNIAMFLNFHIDGLVKFAYEKQRKKQLMKMIAGFLGEDTKWNEVVLDKNALADVSFAEKFYVLT